MVFDDDRSNKITWWYSKCTLSMQGPMCNSIIEDVNGRCYKHWGNYPLHFPLKASFLHVVLILSDSHPVALNPLILEQLNYNPDTEHAELNTHLPTLNNDQGAAYIWIIESIEQQDPKVFFMNGQAGSGKTYMYNMICAKLQSEGLIIPCMSSSGISTLLIRGRRTAHSIFKIPMTTSLKRQCVISQRTVLALTLWALQKSLSGMR